ncbi:MAG TPA: hypothetical protein VL918_00015 [Sphingobium sp.]|nr:hypothetical protein [Sphingobium sp.]
MSEAAIEGLDRAATDLRDAMEMGDADRIASALNAFVPAIEAVRGIGAVRASDALKDSVRALRTRLASHHMLARLLGDLTTQRLDLVAGAAASPDKPLVYRRRV